MLLPTAGHLLGWLLVSVLTAVVVIWRVGPARWRPVTRRQSIASLVAATVCAYLTVSVGAHAGFNSWLDEAIDGPTDVEIDGTDVWLVSSVAALAVLGLVRLRRRSR